MAGEGVLSDVNRHRGGRWWRGHRVALTTALIATVGVAATVLPPLLDATTQERTEEVDGRTWLGIQRNAGPTAVLVNGISGLVEASAQASQPFAGTARFVGSNARYTLMRTASTAVLVADGSHRAGESPLPAGASPALASAHVVIAGQEVVVRHIGDGGKLEPPVPVSNAGQPVSGAMPVVDSSGSAWVLRDVEGRRRAMRVGTSGRIDRSIDVSSDASRLVVVDGEVRAVGPFDGRVPDVSVATGGVDAAASGPTITVEASGSRRTLSAPAAVTHLAVWHGTVWATTTAGLFAVEGDSVTPIAAIGAVSDVFTDGGRLWAVSGSTAAAVDRDQRVTLFRLAAVDLNLCPGSCTAADAVEFIEKRSSTTSSSATPTTTTTPTDNSAADAPTTTTSTSTTTPALTLPPVEPALATTTTAMPTTTTAAPTTTAPRSTATTAAPSPPSSTSTSTTTLGGGSTPTPGTEPGPPPSSSSAPPPPPPPPPPPSTSTQPTVPPTLPPSGGSLTLYAEGGSSQFSGDVRIGLGFNGSAEMCENNTPENNVTGNHTTAGLAWSGSAGSGERYTSVKFSGGGAYSVENVNLGPGQATFSLYLCGMTTTINVEVTDSEPQLGAIDVAGTVEVGQTVTASARYSFGPDWSAHPSWTFGPCGAEAPLDSTDTATRTTASLTFTQIGQHCVFLTVSFTKDGADPLSHSASANVDAQTPATNPPATDPPNTTPPVSNPPVTNPPVTNPPVTNPPTTTTTTPPTTTPPTTTTTPPTTTAPPTTTTAPPTTTTAPPTTTTAPPTTTTGP